MSKNKTLPFTKVKYNIECNIVWSRLGVQHLQIHFNTVKAGILERTLHTDRQHDETTCLGGAVEPRLRCRRSPFDLGCQKVCSSGRRRSVISKLCKETERCSVFRSACPTTKPHLNKSQYGACTQTRMNSLSDWVTFINIHFGVNKYSSFWSGCMNLRAQQAGLIERVDVKRNGDGKWNLTDQATHSHPKSALWPLEAIR